MKARTQNGGVLYCLKDPNNKTHLLTIQSYKYTSIINPCTTSSMQFVKTLVTEVKDVGCNTMHCLGDVNHDCEAQEFDVTAVWFSAAKKDVLVSPASVHSFMSAYLRPLTGVCVSSLPPLPR